MTHVPDSRPSSDAARIALLACAVGVAGLLLFPLATLGRGFSADAVLLHLGGSVLNLSASQQLPLPAPGSVIALGWATLAALIATLIGAWRRSGWFWITALLTLVLALGAVLVLGGLIGSELSRVGADTSLRPGAKRQLRNFYDGGGMNLGLLLPILAGLIAAGAGLSARGAWWERLNRLRGLLVPTVAIALAILVGAIVVLVVQPLVNLSGQPLSLWGAWLAKTDLMYFVYSTLFAPVTSLNPLLDSLKLATPLIFTGLSVAFAFRTGLFNIGAPGQLTMGAIGAMLVGVYGPSGLGWALLPLSVIAAGAGGALWGAIPGFLKARFGSSEVINTIMLNYIASAVFIFLIGNETFPFFNGITTSWSPLLATVVVVIGIGIYKPFAQLKMLIQIFTSLGAWAIIASLFWRPLQFTGRTYTLGIKAEGFEPRSEDLQPAAQLPTLLNLFNVGQGGQVAVSIGLLVALVAFLVARPLLRRTRNSTLIALGVALLAGALTWRIGIPVSIAGSQLNASFLIALLCVAFFGTLMWRTSTGYALRAVGLSPKAAEYGGISVARGTVLAMTIAGMFAGLAGTHYVNGGALDEYRLKGNMPVNVGFDGIAVALMGQSTPGGVVAASLLFGTVDTGGIDVDQKLENVNKDIVTVLKALIVLFIAAGGFLSRRITDPPPPQLLAAAAQGLKPEDVVLSPGTARVEKATPLPNVAPRAEGGSQATNTKEGGEN